MAIIRNIQLLAALPALGLSFAAGPVGAQPLTRHTEVKSLFCAHGSVEFTPISLPPDFESEFAVAVVEIDSSKAIGNVTITGFTLFDQAGKATTMKRLVKVESFDEPRVVGDGDVAYYLNTADGSRSKPWDGTLPVGKIRLRIRVALAGDPGATIRYVLNVGPFTTQGTCDIAWPT